MSSYSFKDIDQHFGHTKGWAFKQFKSHQQQLKEGADFLYLSAVDSAAEIAALKNTGKVYANSVNVVLITPRGLSRMGIEIIGQ